MVSDETGHTYEFFPGFPLEPGVSVTLYTGSEADTNHEHC
jgi:hypothetical protein